MMQKSLLLLFLFFSQCALAQRGIIYIKKHGYKTVRSFAEGDEIIFKTKMGDVVDGYIMLVKKDSVFVNNNGFARDDIKTIFLHHKTKWIDSKTFLLITAGVALSTAGITLAKWADFKEALFVSLGIGYGPLILDWLLHHPKRNKYIIGKKFTLQFFDLHF